MKTIEERAKSILLQSTKQPTAIDLYSRDEVLKMLVKMATEQQKIDTDKACEWLEDNAIYYIGVFGITNWNPLRTDFRKAMQNSSTKK